MGRLRSADAPSSAGQLFMGMLQPSTLMPGQEPTDPAPGLAIAGVITPKTKKRS